MGAGLRNGWNDANARAGSLAPAAMDSAAVDSRATRSTDKVRCGPAPWAGGVATGFTLLESFVESSTDPALGGIAALTESKRPRRRRMESRTAMRRETPRITKVVLNSMNQGYSTDYGRGIGFNSHSCDGTRSGTECNPQY
jgi:hypothetical protein